MWGFHISHWGCLDLPLFLSPFEELLETPVPVIGGSWPPLLQLISDKRLDMVPADGSQMVRHPLLREIPVEQAHRFHISFDCLGALVLGYQ
jgi:hypothetical protein